MTNEQIIFSAQQELLNQGKLKPTGRTLTTQLPDGSEIEVPEAEAIHTFNAWKSLGYRVRRGEHAVAQLMIWKHTTYTEQLTDTSGTTIEQQASRMFMKRAHFFSASQVEPA